MSELREKLDALQGTRLLAQQTALLEATECVCKIMEEDGISSNTLALRLGVSRHWVEGKLDDSLCLSIEDLSDMLYELGYTLKVSAIVAQQPKKGSHDPT